MDQAKEETDQKMRHLVQITIYGVRLAPILLTVYWIMLFTGTHIPGSALKVLRYNDKLMHCGAFAGLAFLLAWALPRFVFGRIPGLAIAATVILAYAVFDELTQGFVPHRNPDVKDFVADAIGMVIGFTAYLIMRTVLFSTPKTAAVRRPSNLPT